MILENALYAEIDRLEEALVIANNTITLMAQEIKLLKQRQIVTASLIRENEAMERENRELRELVDGVEDVVESFGGSPAQIEWARAWMERARAIRKEAEHDRIP